MLTAVLIVLALLVLGVVIWAVRRKPVAPPAGPIETDTAWNDPVTPDKGDTPSREPRP